MGTIKQYYGIKFPFTANNNEGFFIDLNQTLKNKVESQIAHVILTTKGSRIRMPEFGTRLVEYIFNQNDDITWDSVREEINEAVSKYVKNASINDIEILSDNDNTIILNIKYRVEKGNMYQNNEMSIKL